MKFQGFCICGFTTPLVEKEEDIDWDYLEAHQEWCEVHFESMKIVEGDEEE